jgi:CNP1-like family
MGIPASAQWVTADPDWKETEAGPPPVFELRRLVPFEVSVSSTLKWGIDPDTVVVAADGTVRYVVVAQSSTGTVNAMYEAIRCNTAEFKTYARYNKDSGWKPVTDAQWQALGNTPSRYALRLAQQGVCVGAATAQTPREVIDYIRRGGPNR